MKQAWRFGGIGLILAAIIVAVFALVSGRGSEGGLDYRLQVKDKVITGVYKVYGTRNNLVPLWLAKAVFQNKTKDRITGLKIRYRVAGYADWCSWRHYAMVVPNQTVVDLYYPIFSDVCARLTTRAPAELQMEYEYTDARGNRQQETESRALTMLGRNELYFSDLTEAERTGAFMDGVTNAPLLAAWVSRGDHAVNRLASLANKKAGGLGASTDAKSCLRVMEEIYNIMRTIHISYQHPEAMRDPNLSFDLKLVQSLQYPRETLQKRSGTCIDLAILYAAMLNSVNIPAFLVVLDGHCFPVGMTPDNRPVPVETTGVQNGYDKARSFEDVVKIGFKELQTVSANGRFVMVDVRNCWMNGIANPELPPLPDDILERWGIISLVEGAGGQRRAEARPPQPEPRRRTQGGGGSSWLYVLKSRDGRTANGHLRISVEGETIHLLATSAYSMMGPDGKSHVFRESFPFTGKLSGYNLMAECRSGDVTMDGNPIPPQGLPFRIKMVVAKDVKSMQGDFINGMGIKSAIYVKRQ